MREERFMHFINLIDGIHKSIQKMRLDHATSFGIKSVHIFWMYELSLHPEGLSAAERLPPKELKRQTV